jgi:hypothetical protein
MEQTSDWPCKKLSIKTTIEAFLRGPFKGKVHQGFLKTKKIRGKPRISKLKYLKPNLYFMIMKPFWRPKATYLPFL